MTSVGQALLAAVVLALTLSAPAFLSDHQIHILIQILFFAYVSSCWNILGGFAGQLSFGHALFLGVGAYTSTLLLLNLGLTPWLGMLAGGTLAGAIGLFHRLSELQIRHQGDFFRSSYTRVHRNCAHHRSEHVGDWRSIRIIYSHSRQRFLAT